MRIISFKILHEFYEREPHAETAIKDWFKKAEKADWNNTDWRSVIVQLSHTQLGYNTSNHRHYTENNVGLIYKSNWYNFSDIKKSFNSVDSVGNMRYVFDIKGNDFRIVAKVVFKIKTIYIRFMGTHQEYDKITNIDKI